MTGATPTTGDLPAGLGDLGFAAGATPATLEEILFSMPDDVAGLAQQETRHDSASATVVYLKNQDPNPPMFGMVVAIAIEPSADAKTVVETIQRERWGDPKLHTVTSSGDGSPTDPAWREFWRTFPPGQFAIPNQPVYFLVAYRPGDPAALMVMGSTPVIRRDLTVALAAAAKDA